MNKLPAQYWIDFAGCEGYGTKGRSATIRTIEGEVVTGKDASGRTTYAYGDGETDTEAVLEALVGLGYTFDQAFDAAWDTVKQAARMTYTYCERNEG